MSPAASTRWCPTPEQVMILEEMYRGGVRTPNAAHIQQITAHLSLYGKIEGKNVFYWFQNHKARDRQKLRKRLLGKQQQQQLHQHIMFQIPADYQPPPPLLHHRHHFDQLPACCASSSSIHVGFHHQPPPMLTSPCFASAHHQSRCDDSSARMANIYNWKGDTLRAHFELENEKLVRITNHNDWTMRQDHDYDNHSNYYDDDGDDEHCTTRSLKTLELFPIKDKTSLKNNNNNVVDT
ncbi:hypothetical protein RND81_05G271800 [Saponaria officinalis]|uniref:Homeobox domain-containing protein n=1 Tax=Saponaria officinalis TaxID=3572 RepID=A0AAW1L414_SAPOF